MNIAQFLLLCSSTLAVKVAQLDTTEDTLAQTSADTLQDEEEYSLAETEAFAEAAMPASFTSTVQANGKRHDQRTFLSTDHGGTYVDLWWSDDGSGKQQWRFTRVPGKVDEYVVDVPRGKSNGQSRKTLSVPGCGRDYVDLWHRDDGDGKQRWQLNMVEPKKFTMRIVNGRHGCGRNFMSTGHEGTYVDLWYSDGGAGDGKQRWTIKDFPGGAATNEITKINGYWTTAGSANNGTLAHSLEKSVENSSGQTLGNSQTSEFSISSSVSVEVGGVTNGIEVGFSTANTASRETSTQLTHATKSTCSISCPAKSGGGTVYGWQWATRSTTSDGNYLSMLTCHYDCTHSPNPPTSSPWG